jgi:hypothetical protein
MITAITIRDRGATPRGMGKIMREALKAGYEAAGIWWHRECRPKHFTRAAYALYQYTPRMGESGTGTRIFKNSYTGRKLKKFGHTNPMVYTGVSQQLTRVRDVRATSKGVRIVMSAPALNFRPKGGRINMVNELRERFTADEISMVAKIIDGVIDNKLKTANETSTRTL